MVATLRIILALVALVVCMVILIFFSTVASAHKQCLRGNVTRKALHIPPAKCGLISLLGP